MMWSFAEGIGTANDLNERTSQVGWYVNIGGGVLHRGCSNHDLDLVMVPRHKARLVDLTYALAEHGWTRLKDAESMRAGWTEPDTKHVERWLTREGKLVDVIILRTENT